MTLLACTRKVKVYFKNNNAGRQGLNCSSLIAHCYYEVNDLDFTICNVERPLLLLAGRGQTLSTWTPDLLRNLAQNRQVTGSQYLTIAILGYSYHESWSREQLMHAHQLLDILPTMLSSMPNHHRATRVRELPQSSLSIFHDAKLIKQRGWSALGHVTNVVS